MSQQPYNNYVQQIPTQSQVLAANQRLQVIQTPVVSTSKYKTTLCRHFKNGNCQLGQTCHFAHGMEELRNSADPMPMNLPASQPKVLCNNFKTVRCQYYQKGYCKNQNACSFAHGDIELLNGSNGQFNSQPGMPGNQESMILLLIISNLEYLFKNDPNVQKKLQVAQSLAKAGDQNNSFNILNDIFKDPARSDEERMQYQTICNNAQVYYQSIYSQQQQLLTQQQYAMAYNQPYYLGMQQQQQQYGKIQY